MAQREHDPGVMMAKLSLMACSLSETMKMLDPVGKGPFNHSDTADAHHPLRGRQLCSIAAGTTDSRRPQMDGEASQGNPPRTRRATTDFDGKANRRNRRGS